MAAGHECTFLEPVRKRGPPKGYMNALEQRLSNAEALLGALVCSNDPRATSIITDLSEDSLASSILSRIKEGGFGLSGRLAQEQLRSSSSEESRFVFNPPQLSLCSTNESLMSKLDMEFDVPSIEWQDCLNIRLALGSKKIDSSLRNSSSSRNVPQKAPEQMFISDALKTARHEEELNSNEDIHMRDRESVVDHVTPRSRVLIKPPWLSSASSYCSPCGIKHHNRPVCLVLLHALNIEINC